MKKLTILVIVVSLIAFLYGCCSHSDSGVFVNPQGDAVISQRTVVIDEYGRLPTVSFPSGTIVSGAEENTLQPGIKVILTEQEVNSKYLGYFSESDNTQLYEYKITAYQESSDIAGNKTYVSTIEKPFTVIIPTNAETGVCYIGIRESETDPWRFQRVVGQNENLANIVPFRASTDIPPKECAFNLHRLGTSFCLAIYNGKDKKELPETVVDTLFASSTASILIKDGKYLEDLQITGVLNGLKLGNIKPTNFATRITYRSNMATEAPIKVNGTAVKQTNKADKTVPGYTYYHTFIVDNVTDFSLINTNGDFNFVLNLKGVETRSFPSGFLLEFYNKVDSDNILPYNYTEFYSVNKVVKEPEGEIEEEQEEVVLYDINYDISGGSFIIDNPKKYGEASDTIFLNAPIKEGYTFLGWTGSNGNVPQINVAIEHGSTGEKTFVANWGVGSYKVILTKGKGIDKVSGEGTYESGVEVTASCTMLAGYEFDFWTGNNKETTFNMPDNDVVMQANAKLINYSIYCDLNGGSLSVANPTSYNVDSKNITLINPVRLGYTFKGWSGTDLEGEENLAVTIPKGSTGNREYLANWKLDTYTITCNIGEGNLPEPIPTSYDVNSADITLSNPVSA
ncbi:MAG: InlB B-repeat-containing protein, partial [Candidatus Riflebacteria bacterium]|nr:InlB B-repeat-containing protein [Candidatus Riflebacteria bacterium]